MSQRLIILMPDHPDGPGLWGRFDGEQLLSHGRDAPPVNAGGETVMILAGQMVRFYGHELPNSSRRDRLRAAGFSIEDKVAAPLDDMHIALDESRIGVMARSDLQKAIDQLGEAGLMPTSAYADFDVLSSLTDDAAFLGRIVTPGEMGHSIDKDWAENQEAKALSDEQLLGHIVRHIETGTPLNLLQNEFSRQSGFALDWRRLAPMGAIAACLGLCILALQGVQTRALNIQSEALTTKTAQMYSQASGEAAPSNPALEATRAMQSGGDDAVAFLQLSDILFRGVAQVEGLSVDQLRYQDSNKALQLRLIYPSFESAAQFEEAVKDAGGQIATGGVRDQSGQFVGDATLAGPQ